MFKNYQVFEITRPFWNHPQVQEDLSRHWKLSGNFKKKECKGNRNDLKENKIKNFIFVKNLARKLGNYRLKLCWTP